MAKSFHQYSPRAQALTCAVVSALGLATAWRVLLAPEREDLALRRERMAVVTADIARASQVAHRLPAVQRQVASLEAELHGTIESFPDEKNAQVVLRRLYPLATEANLSIKSFRPKPGAEHETYSEWPTEVSLEGGYHDLGRFLDRVASDARLVVVSNLHFRINTGAAFVGRGLVLASCTATTFVFSPIVAEGQP